MKKYGYFSAIKFPRVMLGLAVVAVIAAGLVMADAADQSTPLTQAEYLQWLVRVHGDNAALPAKPAADDYLHWAVVHKIEPKGGWKLDAPLTREAFAETLAQLFGLPAQDNAIETLAKEGLVIPAEKLVARSTMLKALGEFGFQSRVEVTTTSSGTPVVPPPLVTICHHADDKSVLTIRVAEPAVPSHLAHGDTVGACQ